MSTSVALKESGAGRCWTDVSSQMPQDAAAVHRPREDEVWICAAATSSWKICVLYSNELAVKKRLRLARSWNIKAEPIKILLGSRRGRAARAPCRPYPAIAPRCILHSRAFSLYSDIHRQTDLYCRSHQAPTPEAEVSDPRLGRTIPRQSPLA